MERLLHLIASEKVVSTIKQLYPKWEVTGRVKKYYIEKIKYCSYIFVIGIVLIVALKVNKKGIIEEGGRIKRNDYGDGSKKVKLLVDNHEMDFEVSEKRYSEDEINVIVDAFKRDLFDVIKDENKSFDYVDKNLNFINKLKSYPFTVSYRTDKPLILSSKGVIDYEKVPEEGIDVMVTVTISYFEYEEEISFYVCVYRKLLTEEEQYEEYIKNALNAENDVNKEDDYYYLPVSFNGQQIEFKEDKENTFLFLTLMLVGVIILVYVLKDRELSNELKIKEERIVYEYPTLINKFALLYSAGLPVKNIWMRVCADYERTKNNKKENNPLYEEMLITRKQIIDGKREVEAYEEFSERINNQRYRVFVSLLCQAVTVGRSDLALSFRLECNDAYLERRNRAKKKFEEAGTKLMVPMFMMLSVIIIILMFPAFYSFKI
ncbi:MAG: type II secretion system F family protein [Lachnospiraceae bacterium]|nr:type II secretion system F family protein [Lachnospiraceae bacterium]